MRLFDTIATSTASPFRIRSVMTPTVAYPIVSVSSEDRPN